MEENKVELAQVEQSKVRMNIWMSKKMFTFLEDVSSRDGRSMSDIVRESIRDYMLKHKDLSSEEASSGS